MRFVEPLALPAVQYWGYAGAATAKFTYWLNAHAVSGENLVIAIASGQQGLDLETQSDAEIVAAATRILKTICNCRLPTLAGAVISRWQRDRFAAGTYSYAAVGSTPTDFAALAAPVTPRLTLAGEHTDATYRGTAHGAYRSGQRAARWAIATLNQTRS
ncbi:MAG: FAD-dependent oxidoreductase [Spirulinaceae cyanobacterium RM2_2_10]|nr:FAD-dependent oxidoreductase [Spirulinaceae cyanobacterium RM2_2_10]